MEGDGSLHLRNYRYRKVCTNYFVGSHDSAVLVLQEVLWLVLLKSDINTPCSILSITMAIFGSTQNYVVVHAAIPGSIYCEVVNALKVRYNTYILCLSQCYC